MDLGRSACVVSLGPEKAMWRIYIAFMVKQRAAAPSEVVLLHYRNLEASFCEARRGRNTANSSTWKFTCQLRIYVPKREHYQLQWPSFGSSFLS